MKIGFANIFSFRPHVEHLMFLSKLMEDDGHEVFYLTCDAGVSNCYPRALKGTSKIKECSQCIMGGVRSYTSRNVSSISSDNKGAKLSSESIEKIALSSSCTLNRTESETEWHDEKVISDRKSLYLPVEDVYHSALTWIEKNHLEAVICFNGRMDLPRALTFACEQAGIPYITHERTWFGDGLHLVPNANCLSIDAMGKMVCDFDDKPLTIKQAKFAGKLIGERFLQRNRLEWRLYNENPENALWPEQSTGKKVLVLPSSKNEFAGHDEWSCGWEDNTKALDDFFAAFSIDTQDVVVRFHPNWSENIGKVTGERPLDLYTKWAKKNNLYYISSEEKANTYDLIQQADIVVMNGGSSAVEAGACGKQVICLGPSSYDKAGFVRVFNDKEEMEGEAALIDVPDEIIVKKTLRYVYLRAKRFPQYVDYVKAIETTKYEYVEGADPSRIIDALVTGDLKPDDDVFAQDESEESHVTQLLKNKEWEQLADAEQEQPLLTSALKIQRRFGFRWVDSFRSRLNRGDR